MPLNMNGLDGNELSAGDYTRNFIPEGRWSDAWSVFKTNFGKTVLINLLVCITFIPSIVLMFFRSFYIEWMYTANSVNQTITYPFASYTPGLEQGIVLYADLLFIGDLKVSLLICTVGESGAAYSYKKLLNTHGDFTLKGFFHGVRKCYFKTLLPMLVFMILLYGMIVLGDYRAYLVAIGEGVAGVTTGYVFVIIFMVLAGIYGLWFLAVGASYKLSFGKQLKYSLFMVMGTPLQTLIMIIFAGIPVWLYLLGLLWMWLSIIMLIVFIFLGFTFILLSWMAFAQWGFDQFTNPEVQVEKAKAEEEKRAQEQAIEDSKDPKVRAMELLAAGKSELLSHPIMPIASKAAVTALGYGYTRADIAGAAQKRAVLESEVADFESKHIKDDVYVEYNKLFATREKVIDVRDKKGRRKKISSSNLFGYK